ncbi:MAG: hypothetical protein MJ196_12125 [Treponemataceae bacterium]|nr:hypothetical protein [Treponemataceae bacterium]
MGTVIVGIIVLLIVSCIIHSELKKYLKAKKTGTCACSCSGCCGSGCCSGAKKAEK